MVASSNKIIRMVFKVEFRASEKYFSIAEKIIPAARSFGKPNMPVEMAGIAMDDNFNSSATLSEPLIASASFLSSSPSPQTGPTAWIIYFAGSAPPEVQAGCACETSPCCLNPFVAFFLDHIPAAPHNRPSYAAAMLQMFIRRIDDCIHFINRNVALNNLQGLSCCKNSLY